MDSQASLRLCLETHWSKQYQKQRLWFLSPSVLTSNKGHGMLGVAGISGVTLPRKCAIKQDERDAQGNGLCAKLRAANRSHPINPRWSIDAHAHTFRCPCALSFAALVVHRPGTDEPHAHEQSSRCTLIATAQTDAAPNF